MSVLKFILYLVAAFCLVSAIFVFLPWEYFNAFIGLFSDTIFPDDAVVRYMVRAILLTFFWVGVLIVLAVREPAKYGAVLTGLGLYFLSWAVVSGVLVWTYSLPSTFYGDLVSGIIIGILFLVYRAQNQ
ncbi:MAG: hypothetical protein V3S73_02435 [Gammaproteobacteria bacterium]